MKLIWNPKALEDRERIMEYIATENPAAAIDLDNEFEAKAEACAERPKLYKLGRAHGTREAVVQPNYIMVVRERVDVIEILRVLHARRKWP